MYHRVRKKMITLIILTALITVTSSKSIETTTSSADDDNYDNQIIDFDDEYAMKVNKKYGGDWRSDFKDSHRYTITNKKYDEDNSNKTVDSKLIIIDQDNNNNTAIIDQSTTDYSVIPLELVSTTEDPIATLIESTEEPDLTVIPLSTTSKIDIKIEQTVTLPTTEGTKDEATEFAGTEITTEGDVIYVTDKPKDDNDYLSQIVPLTADWGNNDNISNKDANKSPKDSFVNGTTSLNVTENKTQTNKETKPNTVNETNTNLNSTSNNYTTPHPKEHNSEEIEEDVPIFTELDLDDREKVPEDYYDAKDVIPTAAPKTDALSVLFGLAGSVVESVVESVAERVVPKSIFDLFKRMQKQNEALEAERLRSKEENGGLGQFGRGILKSISSGLKPLSSLVRGADGGADGGALDTDSGFITSVTAGVSNVANVANSVVEAFKDKVQAIYPGTVWCGDGHLATARSSSELGLFFFTDTCCRQHDACKIYIRAGETKYELTNTGLFTRSHCTCDAMFRACLRRTNSLVSSQIGLTYFNVLSPQCFRRAHPIVKCLRRTGIGQKCEEYELDYTKPKMWQWFDNETF